MTELAAARHRPDADCVSVKLTRSYARPLTTDALGVRVEIRRVMMSKW
jgi:hypothetical protein